MLKDILTVEEFIITRLKNALYIAYTERVKNRIQNWIDSFPSGTEQNAKLLAQRTVLAQTWEPGAAERPAPQSDEEAVGRPSRPAT